MARACNRDRVVVLPEIAWNFGVPYVMCARLMRNPEDGGESMSLMPGVELVLFLAWLATAFLTRGKAWVVVGAVGLLSIIGSYVHLLIAGFICGFILRKAKQ